ncbi:ABC transporter permease [Rhizohabitans arisaemae]|uniref:ABC transporter permease n=1 Tax=Rhizohabitans arisaemae TaxID=2720610 RepID=UPI0024B0B440|nr:ABC transporter permease [Rhizohabitans arisaemae]
MTAITSPRVKAPSVRVGPLSTLRQTMTLAWRSLVQIKHNPMELLELSLQPIMFVLLFVFVFGGAIAGSTENYIQFALPGIIVQNAVFATLTTAIGLNTDIAKGVFDRLRSLPIARTAPLAGRVIADLTKQVWSIAIVLGLGMLLGFRLNNGPAGVLGATALLLVVALAVSWVSVLIGVIASEPEKVQIFAFVLLMPLTFTSNVFVPSATMPGALRAWAEINPVSVLADAVRGLLSGGPVATPILQSLLWAAAITVVFAPLAIRALRRKT